MFPTLQWDEAAWPGAISPEYINDALFLFCATRIPTLGCEGSQMGNEFAAKRFIKVVKSQISVKSCPNCVSDCYDVLSRSICRPSRSACVSKERRNMVKADLPEMWSFRSDLLAL